MEDQRKGQQIKIELNDEVGQVFQSGGYQSFSIGVQLDFVRVMPGMPKAQVKSRIILTPEHAKRLLAALNDNISRYESSLFRHDIDEGPAGFNPIPFGGHGDRQIWYKCLLILAMALLVPSQAACRNRARSNGSSDSDWVLYEGKPLMTQ